MNLWNEAAETISHLVVHSLLIGIFLYFILLSILHFLPEKLAALRCNIAIGFLIALPLFTLSTAVPTKLEGLRTLDAPPVPVPSLVEIAAPSGFQSPSAPWAEWIAVAWMIGASISVIRLLRSYLCLDRLARHAIPLTEPGWIGQCERLRRQLGIPHPVRLGMSHHIHGPVTFGWIRPVILFPVSMMSGIPSAHVGPILAHEMAHLVRRDFPIALLIRLVEAILFFHPAVWLISRIIREEREKACDDLVVRNPYPVRSYAKALLWVESHRSSTRAPSAALAIDGTSVTTRTERLLRQSERNPERISGQPSPIALVLLGAAFLALALTGNTKGAGTSYAGSAVFHEVKEAIERTRIATLAVSYPAVWAPRNFDGRPAPLFRSVLLLERDGVVICPFDESVPLFEGIPNSWILENELNPLDGQLPSRDSDKDGFSNREEFSFQTDPRDASSHPWLIHKLQYLGRKADHFTLHYSAQPDQKTAQVHVRDHREPRSKSEFLSAGEFTNDRLLRIDSIGKKSVACVFLPTGESLVLEKSEPQTISIPFGRFQFNEDSFLVKQGESFRIAAEPEVVYQLRSVTEQECLVELPDGRNHTIQVSNRR